MRRRGKGAKGLPLAELRELLKDTRVHIDLGVVFTPDGGTHYYKETANGRKKVMVEVETSSGLDLTCRLATRPTWYIPTPGTVVIVAIPMGELEHCPSIVGILDSGAADDEIGTDKTLVSSEVPYVVKAPSIKHGENADQSAVQGDNLKSANDAFADAVLAWCTGAVANLAAIDPVGALTATLTTAVTAFKAAAYRSTKVKTE